ncbi:MAG: cyanophycinase [Cyclobacteriaceae bacterium]|nr:cyanophycinase [Cyclobacteriaceae bacterium]
MQIKLINSLPSLALVLVFGCSEEFITTNVSKDTNAFKDTNNVTASAKAPGGGGSTQPLVYYTGDQSDVTTTTSFGIALIGGADSDTNAETAAFQFMTAKSGGGDFVVIRSSGADGYNNYVYSVIGGVNSVETIIVDSRAKADHALTETLVRNAEAIFIAGGDQSNYINFWKDSKLEDAINYAINTKHVPIGGTSAGLAILGQFYYGAFNGSITSSAALSNPYHKDMAGLGGGGFLNVSYMTNVITDSHYNERDRQGRHFTFMARLVQDFSVSYSNVKGIGVDEATSVLVETNGTSKVYGAGNAYFLQGFGGTPELCQSRKSLTWNRGGQAVKAYVVPGTTNGTNTFNFNTWSGAGGTSQYWSANAGNFVRN